MHSPMRAIVAVAACASIAACTTAGVSPVGDTVRARNAGLDLPDPTHPDSVEPFDPIARSTVVFVREHPSGKREAFCSGTLVDAHWVLSAGHCLHNPAFRYFAVFTTDARDARLDSRAFSKAGRWSANTHVRALTAADIILHPDYRRVRTKGTPDNDLAMVRLSAPAPAPWRPAKLLSEGAAIQEATQSEPPDFVPGEPLILAGYGIRDLTEPTSQGALKLSDSFVNTVMAKERKILLGPHPGHGACPGDSGGAAFGMRGSELILVGVTAEANCKGGGVRLVDVRPYAPWLDALIAPRIDDPSSVDGSDVRSVSADHGPEK